MTVYLGVLLCGPARCLIVVEDSWGYVFGGYVAGGMKVRVHFMGINRVVVENAAETFGYCPSALQRQLCYDRMLVMKSQVCGAFRQHR